MEQFLDLNEKWVVKEEKTLELRLGPPGEQEWTNKNSYGYNNFSVSDKSSVKNPVLMKTEWQQQGQFLQLQNQQSAEKKVFSTAKNNSTTAVTNNSAQKRTAPGPVVGWPPVRSFRKNLASGSNSSSSKSASESPDVVPNKVPNQKPIENNNSTKGLFVKINMDGIPIGRKVDLKACDSYVKLSYVVDELFRGLIAAQNDTSGIGIKEKENGGKIIGGLLDGSGEYKLVYEDNEGDKMLVGDVPWNMFISTVKRLRVLKSSELPTLARGSKQGKLS